MPKTQFVSFYLRYNKGQIIEKESILTVMQATELECELKMSSSAMPDVVIEEAGNL